jgi:hypothetical protein
LARKRRTGKPPLWDRRDSKLAPSQRAQKAEFLSALSLARAEKRDLQDYLKRKRLSTSDVLKKTSAVKMRHGRLVPKAHDCIPRSMKIYENRKLVLVEVANSNIASDIGRYWNAVGKLTEKGKSRDLRKLRRRKFRDIQSHYHTFERDPKVILQLEARKPKPEQFEIYKR